MMKDIWNERAYVRGEGKILKLWAWAQQRHQMRERRREKVGVEVKLNTQIHD